MSDAPSEKAPLSPLLVRELLLAAVLVLASCLVTGGVWLVCVPAALVVAGVCLGLIGWFFLTDSGVGVDG